MSAEAAALNALDATDEPGGSVGQGGPDGPLARSRSLLAALGDPHRRLRVVHVAGSVGKGAVSLLIARALRAAGLRVGLYTSPHLVRVEERFDLDGAPVDSDRLAQILAAVDARLSVTPTVAPPGLTPFERFTAAAFVLFAEAGVDWAIVEAGLGGRFDATNVVEAELAVITRIAHDHTARLGKRLEQIACHKAGIIKPGRPVVSARQAKAAQAVLATEAAAQGAPLHVTPVKVAHTTPNAHGQRVRFERDRAAWELQLGLFGRFQAENAALALGSLEVLGAAGALNNPGAADALEAPDAAGIAAVRDACARAWAEVAWPGRFDVRPGRVPIVFDGAHNPAAARALAEALEERFSGRRAAAVFALSSDKPAAPVIKALAPAITKWFCCEAPSSRLPARPAGRLAALVRACGGVAVEGGAPAAALAAAEDWSATDGIVVVCGSLYLVGSLLGAAH